MVPIAIRAVASRIAYLAGDEICITLSFDRLPDDFAQTSNINIGLQRIERGRNQFAFGFGAPPVWSQDSLTVKQRLPDDIPLGLYLIDGATLMIGADGAATKQQRLPFAPIFLAIQSAAERPLTTQDLALLVANAEKERHAYINCEIQTATARQAVGQSKQFTVLIFCVGCLLQAQQQLEGYSIAPLGLGMSHRRFLEIVNIALAELKLGPMVFDSQLETNFEQATPTFLISYRTVLAVDHKDALDHCRYHTTLLCELLGLDRGQKPREFACVAFEYGSTQYCRIFQQPWYKGNLAADFNPVSTANMIERVVPKLNAQPFLRLLIKTYADATAEEDHGFALLRFWSVLELLADKYVQSGTDVCNPDGSPIFNAKGKPETTGSKVGRVYKYILAAGTYTEVGVYQREGVQKQYMIGADSTHPGYTPETELLSLWDMVRAVYAVRNFIAHEGQFDLTKAATGDRYSQLAARLTQEGYVTPRSFIKGHAHLSVMRELNKT